MKVAVEVLVSMTVLSRLGDTPGGYVRWGPYAMSGECVVRLSRVLARGPPRVFRRHIGLDPRHAAPGPPASGAAFSCGHIGSPWSTDATGPGQALWQRLARQHRRAWAYEVPLTRS